MSQQETNTDPTIKIIDKWLDAQKNAKENDQQKKNDHQEEIHVDFMDNFHEKLVDRNI